MSYVNILVMKRLKAHYINSFISDRFLGNPACVILLEEELNDTLLQKIASDVRLPETAYIRYCQNGELEIRWFTPDIEMDLCGHATLAAAAYYFDKMGIDKKEVIFQSNSGKLKIDREGEYLKMYFPVRKAVESILPENIYNSLNIKPREVYKSRDYLLVYDTEKQIRDISIDLVEFDKINLGPGGVIVTARGDKADFVSRFFTPQSTLLEDPVTGSAHCTLVPYWAEVLTKRELTAWQLSERGGEIVCNLTDDSVELMGRAAFEMEKEIII